MGFFDKFKKVKEKQIGDKKIASKVIKDKEKKAATKVGKAERKEKQAARKESVDTGLAYRNLVEPMVSEKASILAAQGKYVFKVNREANKIEIKKAVERVFNVKVQDVNVINMRGKKVRFGRVSGTTKCWRKAVVTLVPGEKIELYEGV
ncbi:MAG: 50S ribosomal protein L23 [Patescibacteria group bacterium]|nr:50S ribosomal protein L23 [Patescibacteria group bacterium]